MSINKDFIIFSLNECPYCELSTSLLEQLNNIDYIKINVDDEKSNTSKNYLKKNISNMVGIDVKTFPMIFTTEMEFIGGYDDLEHYIHKLSLNDTTISKSCTLDGNGCA